MIRTLLSVALTVADCSISVVHDIDVNGLHAAGQFDDDAIDVVLVLVTDVVVVDVPVVVLVLVTLVVVVEEIY